jgi:hypothetical protein
MNHPTPPPNPASGSKVEHLSHNHDPHDEYGRPASYPDAAPSYATNQDQAYHANDQGDMGYGDRHSSYDYRQDGSGEQNQYDMVNDHLRPDGQFGYSIPYADRTQSELHGTVSSIGPWDSASQRSIGHSSIGPNQAQPQNLRNKPSYAGGLSYIDEEGGYYSSKHQRPASEIEMRGLVHDPSPMGRDDSKDIEFSAVKGNDYDTSPFPYPTQAPQHQKPSGVYSWLLFPTGLDRVLAIFGVNMGRLPVEQEIERKRRGIPGQRFPVAAWTLTVGE